jgi:hypothetical protein
MKSPLNILLLLALLLGIARVDLCGAVEITALGSDTNGNVYLLWNGHRTNAWGIIAQKDPNFTAAVQAVQTTGGQGGIATSLAFQDAGQFGYIHWYIGQEPSHSVPDIWIIATSSNNIQSITQLSPEGAIMTTAGFSDGLLAGGNKAFFNDSFMFPVEAINPTNLFSGTFTNGTFYGDGTGLQNVTAVHYSSVLPTNNLPVATPLQIGAVIPDNVTITIDSNGKISSVASGTNGTSVSNVFFASSGTIGWSFANGINSFFLIPGTVTSNALSGQINLAQVFGALVSVGAASPLASSGGTNPIISLSATTGGGSIVLSNAPTINFPTIGGVIGGTPTFNLANGTNFQCVQGFAIQGGTAFAVSFSRNPLGGTNVTVTVPTNYVQTTIATGVANNFTYIGGGWSGYTNPANNDLVTTNISGASAVLGTNNSLSIGASGSAVLQLGLLTNNTPANSYPNGSLVSTTNGYYGFTNGAAFRMF